MIKKKQRGQGIVKVSDLFKKYRETLRAPQKTVINEFCLLTEEVCGIEILPHQCVYSPRTRTISLNLSGVIKTEVLFNKERILQALKKNLGEKSSPKYIL